MKLWEGNVLSHVCLSVNCSVNGGADVIVTHDALVLIVRV